MSEPVPLERRPFPGGRCAGRLLRLLLAQDGSTTRSCSALLGRPAELRVHAQREESTPRAFADVLGAGHALVRVTSLHDRGQVAMDNLAVVALDAAPAGLRDGLLAGILPVGRLLDGLPLRRSFLPANPWLELTLAELSGGAPDARASRTYAIELASGPLMVVHETYRAALADAFCRRSGRV